MPGHLRRIHTKETLRRCSIFTFTKRYKQPFFAFWMTTLFSIGRRTHSVSALSLVVSTINYAHLSIGPLLHKKAAHFSVYSCVGWLCEQKGCFETEITSLLKHLHRKRQTITGVFRQIKNMLKQIVRKCEAEPICIQKSESKAGFIPNQTRGLYVKKQRLDAVSLVSHQTREATSSFLHFEWQHCFL